MLLLVGERDEPVLRLDQQARHAVAGHVELRILPDASHLSEEPGVNAGAWFTTYFQGV